MEGMDVMGTYLFQNFFKGKRVLVTGHTGFKGSWLTLWLVQLGAHVAGFSAYYPSEPCNFKLLGLERFIEHHEGDIRDSDTLLKVFEHYKPHIVFHCAAQPLVRRSYKEPKLTFDTNLGGTVNVLECIRRSGCVEATVIITSDKCYRNAEWVWGYREIDRLGGDDPYSASKACAEIAIRSYCSSYFNKEGGVALASTRAGNVIGGGDWAEDRIVPDCVRAWSEGREALIRSPRATRPWQHVLEPLSGYLWLGALLGKGEIKGGEAFNFGPQSDVIKTVSELITMFQHYWKRAQWRVEEGDVWVKESGLLKLCCDKALSLLDWRAILNFEETVELTAQWYKSLYEDKGNMYEVSEAQIERYCMLAGERGARWALVRSEARHD
ncbi:MAG: CDP-glucose 4,6-dehydratase [bacterium]